MPIFQHVRTQEEWGQLCPILFSGESTLIATALESKKLTIPQYTQRWDGSYATNSGGYGLDGSAYTISQSVGYYTGSDPGPCQGVISSTTSTTSSTTTTLPPIGLPTAPCDSNGYLVRNNELDRINLASGRTTIVSLAVGTNVNGMGYNILDSYLYASSLLAITPTLVQIGGLGASVPVAQLPLPGGGSNYNLGDVDERGQYWASYNGQTWIQVDLAPGSPTRGSVFAMNVADPQGFVPLDWAYVPGGGDNLWALGTTPNYDTTQLMRFIREAGVWVLETNFGKIAGRNSWGAVFAGANQTLIGLENLSGEIWQFPLPVVGVTPQRLSYGPVNGGNTDGARCIKAL
ncbi:hypothetical protein GGR51DRAFT_391762 [Nemania sp. FL0031]|nr:hypothetical protein GGR51DRAFT_391762 [Nemania sp. FL0031]